MRAVQLVFKLSAFGAQLSASTIPARARASAALPRRPSVVENSPDPAAGISELTAES
jgi:hypothetical protein